MAEYMLTATGAIFTEEEIESDMDGCYQEYLDNYETDEYLPVPPMTRAEFEKQTWDGFVEVLRNIEGEEGYDPEAGDYREAV